MKEQLTILFAPLTVIGHLNPCIGVAEVLRDSGHRIVFAVEKVHKGRLLAYGFDEAIYETVTNENDKQKVDHFIKNLGSVDKFAFFKIMYERQWLMAMKEDAIMSEIINNQKPDIIVSTAVTCRPYLINYGKPWVRLCTQNPLFLFDNPSLPPTFSGLSVNGNKNEWLDIRHKLNDATIDVWRQFNQWVMKMGITSMPECKFIKESPYLNMYAYPKEIDYVDKLPANYLRFDYFMRYASKACFEIPEQLQNKSGELIYVSMGTLASKDINLMKRLISILSRSKHRFIVSKGEFHEQLELANNMWGERYLPQVNILPLVDLAIIHGGNNSLTETFYFGKPMIIMPIFFDQLDNAQRIHETGYGIRLDVHSYTEQELFDAIESLLNNQELKEKLKKASERIQASDSLKCVAKVFETLV